jgi:hypothetical protein
MKQKNIFFIVLVLLSIIAIPIVIAEEDDDVSIFGLELEKLLNLGSGILALALFFVTIAAAKRTGNKRLKYVSIAFLLFAAKGLLISHELLITEIIWIDIATSVLDFAILLAFFFGIIKK